MSVINRYSFSARNTAFLEIIQDVIVSLMHNGSTLFVIFFFKKLSDRVYNCCELRIRRKLVFQTILNAICI